MELPLPGIASIPWHRVCPGRRGQHDKIAQYGTGFYMTRVNGIVMFHVFFLQQPVPSAVLIGGLKTCKSSIGQQKRAVCLTQVKLLLTQSSKCMLPAVCIGMPLATQRCQKAPTQKTPLLKRQEHSLYISLPVGLGKLFSHL